jgi:ABC-2 type transport system ATP-binding protein
VPTVGRAAGDGGGTLAQSAVIDASPTHREVSMTVADVRTLHPLPDPDRRPAGEPALLVENAHKAFGATHALDGVSLELRDGELLALLGPNGAGKTTLIRAIAGRVKLDRGAITLRGGALEPGRPRPELGVVPQEIALYPLLTVRENLEAWGVLQGLRRADVRARVAWALEWTALAERANAIVRTLSGGMKRRLNLACGVLHRPGVILLDEPTVGVDPQSRERMHEMLAELRASGAALLLTTHQLEEAESRCDRVAIVDHGRIVAAGTLRELLSAHAGDARQVAITVDRAPGALPAGAVFEGGRVVAVVTDLGAELAPLLNHLRRDGVRVSDVAVSSRGLHDVFLHLTGRELRE